VFCTGMGLSGFVQGGGIKVVEGGEFFGGMVFCPVKTWWRRGSCGAVSTRRWMERIFVIPRFCGWGVIWRGAW
jgi:hypothetical protein